MMISAKAPKDKIYATSPRLAPRPTAASVARATHNATNRNHALPMQRQSPVRSPPSPVTSKIKTTVSRHGQNDSKTGMKINRNCENQILVSDFDMSVKQEPEIFSALLENYSDTLKDISKEEKLKSSADDKQNISDVIPIDVQNVDETSTISEYGISGTEQAVTKVSKTPNTSRLQTPKDVSSRPQTPKDVSSRPQTPKDVSTRPQTPRKLSRPTTPAHPLQRRSTPISRPNTPNTALIRPKTPSTPIPTSLPKPVTSQNLPEIVTNDDDVKSMYLSKKEEFHKMKKELDLKQQAILEVFDGIHNLREHMSRKGISSGGEGCQDLVVLNVGDWAPEEVTQLCRDAIAASNTVAAEELFNATEAIDECAVAEVESKAKGIPLGFGDLCLQAFTAQQELIDWIKELINKDEDANDEDMKKIARYNTQTHELCEALYELKTRAEEAVHAVILFSKRACRERSTLVAVGESLVREIAKLRHDLETRPTVTAEKQDIPVDPETVKVLEQTRRELDEQRAAKSAIKEKLTTTEAQLRQSRIRVTKMDRQLREAEASIASLTGTVKNLEDQSRHKEVHLEARARKLKETLKTGEVAHNHLSQQRDSLQAEVKDLKGQIQSLTEQHNSEVQILKNKLTDIISAFEEEKNITQTEREEKQKLEAALEESQSTVEKLRLRVTDLDNGKPNPDIPTEREMDLWAELQATKDTLRVAEEEMNACKKEKVRFLETLTKISESENKIGIQQKLAAELLSKEEIIGNMQVQIRELMKNIKLNEQKVVQYEQYVRDLQAHIRAIARCEELPNGDGCYQELQQEIMDLRMSLLDAVHRNEELSENLVQKEQQLEQKDKTSRAQARIIKVREELINMLKNKETEQSQELATLQQDLEHRMKIVEDVNKQIAAKAEEIREIFATLENKQQQIHRLEKIVFALEEQQRRSQAQRTRHEEKIAALEHELAAASRRERKFIFF